MTGELVIKAIRNLETDRRVEKNLKTDLGPKWRGIDNIIKTATSFRNKELKQREVEGRLPLGVRERIKKVMES
jgi:hypothetical protein